MTPLYSMTGFGKKVLQLPGKKISIEMKSLNSKQADINLRLPSLYRSKEGDIRQLISESLIRGKIDCNINVEITGIESAPRINMELAEGYLKQLEQILESRELVKVNIQKNSFLDTKEAANEVAKSLQAEFVQAIGRKFVIYREAQEDPVIELPR